MRFDYAATPTATLSVYNLVSSEEGSTLRIFSGVGVKRASGPLTLLGELDYGTQSRGSRIGGHSSWYGWAATGRVQTTPAVALVLRAEVTSLSLSF